MRRSDITDCTSNTFMSAEYCGGYVDWSGTNGIPSGWSVGTRSAGFKYSTFGTCPNAANPNCDPQSFGGWTPRRALSFGLSFGASGALHVVHSQTGPASAVNVAMAHGSVHMLPGHINRGLRDPM